MSRKRKTAKQAQLQKQLWSITNTQEAIFDANNLENYRFFI